MKFVRLEKKGKVVGLYRTFGSKSFVTTEVEKLAFTLAGIPGDRHSGFHKAAGVREKNLYRKGLPIANHRQWSAISVEEKSEIAERMGLDEVSAEHIGANLLIEGIPNLSKIPPFSRIRIGKGKFQVTLVVYEENFPCRFPEEAMNADDIHRDGMTFQKAAKDRRGLVGWVEKAARISTGDEVEVLIPEWAVSLYPKGLRFGP